MTYEFNVDRFYAQLGAFSFFVISYDRRDKTWDQIETHDLSNLMLTDFTPNWALFLFSLFHTIRGVKPGSNWISMFCEFNVDGFNAQLGAFSILSIHMIEGWNLDQIESHDLWI